MLIPGTSLPHALVGLALLSSMRRPRVCSSDPVSRFWGASLVSQLLGSAGGSCGHTHPGVSSANLTRASGNGKDLRLRQAKPQLSR